MTHPSTHVGSTAGMNHISSLFVLNQKYFKIPHSHTIMVFIWLSILYYYYPLLMVWLELAKQTIVLVLSRTFLL